MKIAILTANLGNFDTVSGIPKQTVDADFYCYDETNLPFPLANLNNRMKARYLKSQAHRFLPGYECIIWIDGRINVCGSNFVETFLSQLEGNDIALYKHKERKNVFHELKFITSHIKKGTPYLFTRYGNQQLDKEKEFYKAEGMPANYPLVLGGMIARWNNEKVNAAMDEWWRRIVEFSYSDQTMLSYIIWKRVLKANLITYDDIRTPKLFKIGNHI